MTPSVTVVRSTECHNSRCAVPTSSFPGGTGLMSGGPGIHAMAQWQFLVNSVC